MDINEVRRLLSEYNKTKNHSIEQKLISYVISVESELTTMIISDRNFKPNISDSFQERRELLSEIRRDVNMMSKTIDQHPPDDIHRFREELKNTESKNK